MLEGLKSLTIGDILYAALIAFVVTQLINSILRLMTINKGILGTAPDYKEADRLVLIKRCIDMFPVDTIYFRGKVFNKGMKVRITTFQRRIIEGELVGKNDMEILCIVTGQHIVAHEIAKIEDMIEVTQVQA